MHFLRDSISRLTRSFRPRPYVPREIPPVSTTPITGELIQQCVGPIPKPTILEIGCNDGTHTIWLRGLFEKTQVYCFEPEPRAIARFKKNVGDLDRVALFEVALGSRRGEAVFYQSDGHHPEHFAGTMPDGWDMSGSLRKPKDHLTTYPWVKFENTITVETTTLDRWARKHLSDLVDFVWMDVQGAEMDVFKGGRKTFAKTRYIYTEYSNTELYEGQSSLQNLLEQLETFEVVAHYPTDVLLRNTRFAPTPHA